MKLAKWLRRLSTICFLLMWIPFALVMIDGPLRMASGNIEDLKAAESIFNSPWMIAMWALFAGTFVFLLASLLVGTISNRRILASGQSAEARILALSDTGTRINQNPVVNISLEVRPPNHPAFVAETRQTVSIIHLPSFQPGKIVRVKFIPGTEKVAIVEAI